MILIYSDGRYFPPVILLQWIKIRWNADYNATSCYSYVIALDKRTMV